jgi:hypothetical protein
MREKRWQTWWLFGISVLLAGSNWWNGTYLVWELLPTYMTGILTILSTLNREKEHKKEKSTQTIKREIEL